METPKKTLLFSVTKKDFRVDTFRAGGKGGQNQNKTESGVRITHIESGAVGEARDSRDQHSNKQAAFKRCVESKIFKNWHRVKTAYMLQGFQDWEKERDRRIEESLEPKNLKVEVKDDNDRWSIAEKLSEEETEG